MTRAVERDLAVDVLVIGAGIPALYLASALHPRFTVCVVSEPGVPYESYESAGRFSAGYTGNDVSRIQPARRAAGFWRLWAESHGVPHDPGPGVHVLRPEDEVPRTRLWRDAGLAAARLDEGDLPEALAGGSTAGRPIYATPDDVVMDPARVAAELRSGLAERIVAAEVARFGLITEQAVDFVELELPDRSIVPVAPRYVVVASDGANGTLLHKLAAGFKDRARRHEAIEHVRSCQAVRRRTTIVVRGDLPPLRAHVEGMDITSLPAEPADPADPTDPAEPTDPTDPTGTGAEIVWLVELPVDDTLTVVGPDDLRFPPAVDRKVVTEGLDRLFELCPGVADRADALRWSVFVARRTQHPSVVDGTPDSVARPSPAKLESLGMEGLIALWPSHLAYSMIVGDVVAERVRQALGGPAAADDGQGLGPGDLPRPDPGTELDRWQRPDLVPQDWATFAEGLRHPAH